MTSHKKSKILVTGAGGFLGSYIVRDLINLGEYEISSFSRSLYPALENLGVNQIQGDLANYEDVLNATKDIFAVIHVASMVGMWGRYSDFYKTNVIGTENIIKACKENKVLKCVYTSTPSVVFGSESLCGVSELTPYPNKYLSMYAETKAIAEKKILEANSELFSTTAIRPHLLFGPGDTNLIPRVIKAAKLKKLRIIGDGENLVDVTYIENASIVHVMALKHLNTKSPIAGKAYFLGQGPVKLWDFTNEILLRNGLPKVEKKMPFWVAFCMGYIIEKILNVLKIYDVDPPMTRFVALQLAKSHYYSHHNLEKDLNFKPKYSITAGLDILFSENNSKSN
jgi:nucleoside-diphosphate-sugar epimerase